MKVLLIGHACSPRRGSEASFTWNWAWHLSRWHQVWVIAHPHDCKGVVGFLEDHPRPNLKFTWVDVPRWIDPWTSRVGDRGLRFHYMLWLSIACRKAMELHERIGFDIAHHVSYGTISAPPPNSKFGFPFVWGPIGGAQQSPSLFHHYFGRAWLGEIVRNLRVRLLPLSPALRETVQSSAVVLATNDETAQLLARVGARDVRMFLDSGIPTTFLSQKQVYKPKGERFTLLWVGRMQRRKALPIALEALRQTREISVKLLIAGDGEMRKSWEQLARRLGVDDRVQFLGRVPWEEMPRLYKSADAFLFTSLRDSFGMQVLEAMGHGLPILALDHQGVGTFVPAEAGIKVPVTSPEQTLAGLADGIRRLALFPKECRKMGEVAFAYAKTQTWERRAEYMSNLYEEVVSRPVYQRGKHGSIAAQLTIQLGGPASYGSYAVAKRMAKIDKTLDLRGMRVLDLGCGNGCYTEELARRAEFVCGIDVHMPHLQAFQQAIPRVQGRGEQLPFASDSFDAVTMIEVLEHTECDTTVLAECFRVLKPGGLLVLFVPNKLYPFESHPCHIGGLGIGPNIPLVSWLPDFLHKRLCHARIYTRRRLFAMARSIGFQIGKCGFIFPPLDSFPLPFKDAYRRITARLEDSPLGNFGVSIYVVLAKPELSAKVALQKPTDRRFETQTYDVLGVRTQAVQLEQAVDRMQSWIREKTVCHSTAATGMHGVVEAQNDPEFKQILNATDLIVPDGMPLIWLGRRQGHPLRRRVYGPDLLLAFCEQTAGRGYRHFFYGGEPGVAERLAESLKIRLPGLHVVGTYSPPFRPLTAAEDEEIVALIGRAAPDVIWVGLGTPRQERWMHAHKDKLRVPVLVGVGAAFDMLSGRKKQAPLWMREHGLEWFFRLVQEPRRLWRRYLVYGAQFIAYLVLERLRLKNFESRNTSLQKEAQGRQARI
jgi:exopolysaccharide biosynthesis WecB/TagA/CpsF family protein